MIYGRAVALPGRCGSDKMGFWEDKNVLVTGADGFIGSWLMNEKANVIIDKLTFILGVV